MSAPHPSRAGVGRDAVLVVSLAIAIVSAFLLLKGNVRLGLGDEGQLWYGAIRTAEGQVPIRDFRSYDPGRYYWAAAWSMLLGPGFIGLRTSCAIFQAIGLSLALLVLRRLLATWSSLAAVGVLLALWMFPPYRAFEHSLAMAAIFFAVRLVEVPSLKRHFAAGVLVGTAGFFGRNLGLYCLVAFAGLLLFLAWKSRSGGLASRFSIWFLGILVGYSPLLVMLAFVPGFSASFADSIAALIGPGAPLLAKSAPWPWRLEFSGGWSRSSWLSARAMRQLALGVLFVVMPAFYLAMAATLGLSRRIDWRRASPLVASVAVGIPFLHHAVVRSDLQHLVLAIHPFLIGLVGLPFAFSGRVRLGAAVCVISFLIVITSTVTQQALKDLTVKPRNALSIEHRMVKQDVAGDAIWMTRPEARQIQAVVKFVSENVAEQEGIFIAPYMPALYPILGRRSPVWDPYPMFPASTRRQTEMIEALQEKNVNWALISTRALDKRKERSFSVTHDLVWRHLVDEFQEVDVAGLPEDHLMLRRGRQDAIGRK